MQADVAAHTDRAVGMHDIDMSWVVRVAAHEAGRVAEPAEELVGGAEARQAFAGAWGRRREKMGHRLAAPEGKADESGMLGGEG